VLNAANEIAVEAFVAGRIGFLGITAVVEETLNLGAKLAALSPESAADVLAIDAEARALAATLLGRFAQASPVR
jgi:1-deoxy-D-xylulose-5-phosphate reductoisomerase